jgi:hypothetical protein
MQLKLFQGDELTRTSNIEYETSDSSLQTWENGCLHDQALVTLSGILCVCKLLCQRGCVPNSFSPQNKVIVRTDKETRRPHDSIFSLFSNLLNTNTGFVVFFFPAFSILLEWVSVKCTLDVCVLLLLFPNAYNAIENCKT